MVLMAAVNHALEFTWFNIGASGGESDGGILSRSSFGQDLYDDKLNSSKELSTLPGSDIKIPYYFIADDAFPLKKNLMKPYQRTNLTEEEKVYNYRISRARRCIESGFGILTMRWRIFEKMIGSKPDSVDKIVKACVCLHNFLCTMNDTREEKNELLSKKIVDNCEQGSGSSDDVNEPDASAVRESLKNYFISPAGQVSWQLERVRRGLNSLNV